MEDNVELSTLSSNSNLDRSKLSFTISTTRHYSYFSDEQTEGPSVDPNALNNDGSAKSLDPKKSTIGQRRAPQSKKVRLKLDFFFESKENAYRKDSVHKK